MAKFEIAYNKTNAVEGGYANHPNDRGGETYGGIARVFHPSWEGWTIIDAIKRKVGHSSSAINNEANKDKKLLQLKMSFYKKNFWDVMSLDAVKNQKIANELYDTGVNMHYLKAGNFLQKSLNALGSNLTIDSRVGPKTLAALNSLNENDSNILWKMLNCLQGARYISISEANKSQKVFMRGWFTRVFE